MDIGVAISKKEMNSPSSSVNMLAQQVRAWVSARPLQPSVASQYKTTAIPRRRLAVREKEQGRLPRIAACGVTVEVALRLYCHAGGGSRGVDEKLDRRVGLCARVGYCAAPPQAFWRSPGMARWLTKCAGDKHNQQQCKTHCPAPTAQSSPARHLFVRPFSSLPARHMAQCLSMDLSPSRAALPLHLRGAYTSARTPYHQSNPFESRTRTWMRGGHAETPVYGWSWPSDN